MNGRVCILCQDFATKKTWYSNKAKFSSKEESCWFWVVLALQMFAITGVTPFWWTGLDLRFLYVGTISFRS